MGGIASLIAMVVVYSLIKTIKRPDREEIAAVENFNENYQKCVEETLRREKMEKKEENRRAQTLMETKELLLETLRQMGCQPEDTDENGVSVVYQGEEFKMRIGGLMINIWDPGWSSINVNDLNVPRVRAAINMANFEFGPTVVLSEPDEKGEMFLHSRYAIIFHPALPELQSLLKHTFNMFFRAKETVHLMYNRLIVDEESQQRPQIHPDSNPCDN